MCSLLIGLLMGLVFFLFPIVIGITLFFILIVRLRRYFRQSEDNIKEAFHPERHET